MFKKLIIYSIMIVFITLCLGGVIILTTSDIVEDLGTWEIDESKYKENVYWWTDEK